MSLPKNRRDGEVRVQKQEYSYVSAATALIDRASERIDVIIFAAAFVLSGIAIGLMQTKMDKPEVVKPQYEILQEEVRVEKPKEVRQSEVQPAEVKSIPAPTPIVVPPVFSLVTVSQAEIKEVEVAQITETPERMRKAGAFTEPGSFSVGGNHSANHRPKKREPARVYEKPLGENLEAQRADFMLALTGKAPLASPVPTIQGKHFCVNLEFVMKSSASSYVFHLGPGCHVDIGREFAILVNDKKIDHKIMTSDGMQVVLPLLASFSGSLRLRADVRQNSSGGLELNIINNETAPEFTAAPGMTGQYCRIGF